MRKTLSALTLLSALVAWVAAAAPLPAEAQQKKEAKKEAKKNPPKGDGSQEYKVSPNAKITFDGKKVTLKDIPKDAYVRIWVAAEDPKLILEIEASSKPFKDD